MKPIFRVEKELLDVEGVKSFLELNPVEIMGLLKISSDTVRIFYYVKVNTVDVLTSSLIHV